MGECIILDYPMQPTENKKSIELGALLCGIGHNFIPAKQKLKLNRTLLSVQTTLLFSEPNRIHYMDADYHNPLLQLQDSTTF